MKVGEKIAFSKEDIEFEFPSPSEPLLEGSGESCTWEQWMKDTAAQAVYYFRDFEGPSSIMPEKPFILD